MDDKKKRFDFSQGAAEAPHVIDAASVLGNRKFAKIWNFNFIC